MARTRQTPHRWDGVRRLFLRTDDPYAGADLPSSRNAVAVLSGLHGILVLVFLPLFPPTVAVPEAVGWAVALAGVAVNLIAAVWLLDERRRVWFDWMLVLTYLGIAQLLALEFLAQTVLPYQLLMLIWVGASAVQPPQRALTLLIVLVLAALAPIATEEGGANDRDLIGRTMLFAAVGLVLMAYVSHVRAQRVSLRLQERNARAQATAATARVRGLQWITDAVLPHLGVQELLDEVMGRIVRVLEADHGAVLLRSGEEHQLTLTASRGLRTASDAERRFPLGEGLAGRIAMSDHAVTVERLALEGGRLESLLATAEAESVLGVPLVVDRRMLGILFVGTRAERRFTDDDATLLQLVGDRVALAVDRARLFERERHIAETLQRSLLPQRLPQIPGTDIAVRYLPAGPSTEVGGDWYDILELADGRVVLAMGDVMGRGVGAAALMGKLRTSLQAYALDGRSPAEVLERLNSLMARQHRAEMATLVYVVVDPDDRTAEFASAGHMPPLLRASDGRASFLVGDRSPPLGALAYARFKPLRIDLDPNATLLLFTDGLVEQHGLSIYAGLEQLRRLVEEGPTGAEALCGFVLGRLLGDHDPHDDVAMLAFNLAPLAAEGFTLVLPAEPEAVPSARKAVERWLGKEATSERDAYALKVACGEACSNAIEHAYRPGDAAFRVQTSRQGDEVMLSVHDFGTWRDKRDTDRGRGLQLMEALMDSVEISASSEGTTVRLRRRLTSGG